MAWGGVMGLLGPAIIPYLIVVGCYHLVKKINKSRSSSKSHVSHDSPEPTSPPTPIPPTKQAPTNTSTHETRSDRHSMMTDLELNPDWGVQN
jgi:hypothetical protein